MAFLVLILWSRFFTWTTTKVWTSQGLILETLCATHRFVSMPLKLLVVTNLKWFSANATCRKKVAFITWAPVRKITKAGFLGLTSDRRTLMENSSREARHLFLASKDVSWLSKRKNELTRYCKYCFLFFRIHERSFLSNLAHYHWRRRQRRRHFCRTTSCVTV